MSETNSNPTAGAAGTTSSANPGAAGTDGAGAGAPAAALSTAAAPVVAASTAKSAGKTGKAPKSTGALVAVGRVYFRDPASKVAELRMGKFFADGEELAGVDAEHLAGMEEAGQAKAG